MNTAGCGVAGYNGGMRRLVPFFPLVLIFLVSCQPVEVRSMVKETPAAALLPVKTTSGTSTVPGMPVDPPRPGKVETDITYCSPDGLPQQMDLYYPPETIRPPWPVVVYIHGGSWQQGDKETAFYMPSFLELQARGFFIVAINYRLAPVHPFPAQIEDARCAIRFLRANASKYHIQSNHIGTIGDSAGGHLAALLGLAGTNQDWDSAEFADQSPDVQAVVSLYGISDLTRVFENDGTQIWPRVFGVIEKTDPRLNSASPLSYVHRNAPPFLLIHGNLDHIVPFEQSQWLFDALRNTGNSVDLIEVHNADHAFVQVGENPIDPEISSLDRSVVEFFVQTLLRGQ